jgi:hypothetical protein
MSDFTKYKQMREQGAQAEALYRAACDDGLTLIVAMRMVRQLFHLSLVEAKEVTTRAEQGISLEAYQERLVPALAAALDEEVATRRSNV